MLIETILDAYNSLSSSTAINIRNHWMQMTHNNKNEMVETLTPKQQMRLLIMGLK